MIMCDYVGRYTIMFGSVQQLQGHQGASMDASRRSKIELGCLSKCPHKEVGKDLLWYSVVQVVAIQVYNIGVIADTPRPPPPPFLFSISFYSRSSSASGTVVPVSP